jgi:hypothetical protein
MTPAGGELVVEFLTATRAVATPAALDGANIEAGVIPLRLAPDELLLIGAGAVEIDADPDLILIADAGWAGAWLPAATAARFLMGACEWELPTERPAFAQGMVSHLAAKLWFEPDRTLIVVPRPMAAELAERLEGVM